MMTGVLSVVISVVISTNAVLSVSVYQHSGQKNRTLYCHPVTPPPPPPTQCT